ncbi:quinon protein alcohol dehydrogenase-like superfamily [Xylariaceae sp. FL0594]|nr:quinon protein alcohol dehydrogenase-like superfamily [Xylariaceae sp. FL0594]
MLAWTSSSASRSPSPGLHLSAAEETATQQQDGQVGGPDQAISPPSHVGEHVQHSSFSAAPTSSPFSHWVQTAAVPGDEPDELDELDEPVDDDDSDMMDAEEGGVSLYDSDMEESSSQHSLSPSESEDDHLSPLVVPADQDDSDMEDDIFHPHPAFLAIPSPTLIAPENYNSVDFLRHWRWVKRVVGPNVLEGLPRNEFTLADNIPPRVLYKDLKGDECDFQGINWLPLGVTRRMARKCRFATFINYTNHPNTDVLDPSRPSRLLSRCESFFRFRSMDLRRDVSLLHFQLRNILGCASRTRIFYPGTDMTIRELDPTSGRVRTAMSFRKDPDEINISTLAAEEGVLIAGTFAGAYRYRSVESDAPAEYCGGRLTRHPSGITNHVEVFTPRYSSGPVAAVSSNDWCLRTVDLTTNQMTSETPYDHAVNCTRLSPDKRLRVMAGDTRDVIITEAESGNILQRLEGHRDYSFACDWAADGWTIATGNQDKTVRIWDARKWKDSKGKSLNVAMWSEMSGVRSLRFSPLGSGKRVLVAAEEADIINIIDAGTFESKQTIDIFGELAGVGFANNGQEVFALSSDPIRGGVLCLERCDAGVEDTYDFGAPPIRGFRSPVGYDWLPTPQQVVNRAGTGVTITQKQREAALAGDWWF